MKLTRSILSVGMSSALLLTGLAAVPAAAGVGAGPLDEPPAPGAPPPVSSPGRVPTPMSTPAPQVNPDGEMLSLRTKQSRTFQGAKLAGGRQLSGMALHHPAVCRAGELPGRRRRVAEDRHHPAPGGHGVHRRHQRPGGVECRPAVDGPGLPSVSCAANWVTLKPD